MSFDQFDERIRAIMTQKPAWFEGVESPASDGDIARVEAALNHALPDQFKHFAQVFGAGYFGASNISSLVETSDWYVLSRPSVSVNGNPMLVVSDDEAGGYYGFVFDGTAYGPGIVYANPDDGNYTENTAPSFFDYVEKNALIL